MHLSSLGNSRAMITDCRWLASESLCPDSPALRGTRAIITDSTIVCRFSRAVVADTSTLTQNYTQMKLFIDLHVIPSS